jgi:MSHA biogenesis protein MshL
MRRMYKTTCLLTSLMLVACATPPATDTRTLTAIDEALADGIASNHYSNEPRPPVPPSSVSNALLPPVELNLPEQSGIDVEPRFDIKVDHANAREFFMGLVKGTPYNMVVHPAVKGRITLDLKNVTIDEVMQTVRNVYGFDYEKADMAYHVYPDAIRTRIFKLDYLAIKRDGTSRMRVSSGQVTDTALAHNTGTTGNTSNSGPRETVASSSIETTSDSDFWVELRNALQAIVGKGDGRRVVVSPQSGVVVVRAAPAELRAVANYLNTTQNVMHRQVLLQAKVIEVTLGNGFQSGINWAALKRDGSSQALLSQTGGGTIFDNGSSDIAGNSGDLNPGALSQVANTTASAFGGVFTAALNINANFAAFIELLKTQGSVQVLSSPQVSTMNNQKAVIKVGTDEFFVTNVETNTNTSTATTNTQNNVELTPFFSGVALDVIPQISDDDQITLHIHPSVVDVSEKVKNISVSSTQTLSVPLAVSSVRESDTMIRARNGQVVILGGLMKTKTTDDNDAVPFLGDLPLIGGLFKHTKQVTTKSELVILIRPTVIDGPRQWARGLRRVRDNLQRMLGKHNGHNLQTD